MYKESHRLEKHCSVPPKEIVIRVVIVARTSVLSSVGWDSILVGGQSLPALGQRRNILYGELDMQLITL